MRVGVPKEIKNNENRVGMTPERCSASSMPAMRCWCNPAQVLVLDLQMKIMRLPAHG